MDVLKKRRATEKANITRALNYMKAVDTTKITALLLKNKRQIIEGYFQKFEEIQAEIDAGCSNDAEAKVQEGERQDFENNYLEVVTLLDAIVEEKSNATSSSSTSASSSSSCRHSHAPLPSVKLPPINLPTFTGKYEDWTSFSDLFEATINSNPSLSDVQKFQYLKGIVKEDAEAIIRNLQVTASNYAEAWTLLKTRYENEREIVFAELRRLFNIRAVREPSASSIQHVLDQTNECVRSLNVLNQPTDQWDSILVFMTVDKLDSDTRKQWALQLNGSDIPKYSDLCKFLEQHIRGVIAAAVLSKPQASARAHNDKKATHHSSNVGTTCVMCKSAHPLYKCTKFLSLKINDRSDTVKRYGLCMNCLRPNHRVADCTSASRCRTCNRAHNSLLHFSKPRDVPHHSGSNPDTPPHPNSTSSHHGRESSNHTDVLLSTAIVKVEDRSGVYQQCRIMLDSGSQASLITDKCVNALGLQRKWDRTTITGIGSEEVGKTRGKVKLTLLSTRNSESIEIEALIMSRVTGEIPNYPCESNWNHLAGVQLADPSYHQPGPVDILLGAEYTTAILREGKIEGDKNSPTAQNTIFGWVLAGRVTLQSTHKIRVHHTVCETDQIMRRFWELEQLPNRKFFTSEEKYCEEHFLSTHIRNETGRFCVELPVKKNINSLGFSRQQAISRLKQVERRLIKQTEFRHEYNEFMRDYIQLGHMQRIPRGEVTERLGETYYVPHHFVLKLDSTTTKFRVVFDASAKTTTGLSVNDCLYIGATIQDDIFSLVLRFRIHKVILKADAAKMFRQFLVSKKHIDLQRIVWRESPEDEIEDYVLQTITYGYASSPNLATRCMQQIAHENKDKYPVAASKLEEDIYVDDLMSGADSTEQAIPLVKDLIHITSTAGISFRKWTSNDPKVLATIPEELRETKLPLTFDKNENVKALGVQWSPSNDNFSFSQIEYKHASKITKRVVLSQLAKVFDPLGFLAPVTIIAKLFLQELWHKQLAWDDCLHEDLCKKWINYRDGLRDIDQLQIPRWAKSDETISVELHGFSDASEKAYGAVIYMRCHKKDGTYECKMLAAKSKVAPLKPQINIPRLELCGALLVAQLLTTVKSSLKLQCEVYAWTDSMITLQWLSAYPGRWATFIANRVSEVQELVPPEQWNHVRTDDNPADLVSRGITAQELCNSTLWWSGPSWLSTSDIPVRPSINITTSALKEERKNPVLINHVSTLENIVNKFSSLNSLKRALAYVLRFINNCSTTKQRRNGQLSTSELNNAEIIIIKVVQQSTFKREIELIQQGSEISKSNKIKGLNPFVDNAGVLRVGGRISQSDVPFNQKHPIIIPASSHFTKLLIENEHLSQLHGGLKLIWCKLRLNYWIVNAKNTIRFVLRKCVICRRHRADKMEQLMGSLPSSRVNINHAFTQSGVDYAGPFNLRLMKGRNNKVFKGYFAIFVCMATKAVHLEAVGDMTTEAFLAALRRFVSRRGVPTVIYSDCGTNFVGADKELQQFVKNSAHNNAVCDDLSGRGIEWKFNPPSSPHHGGLWEAGVKSVKYHLRRVVGNQTLTYEEFSTVLCQVEACLNSRPLCAMTADPDDYDALTPGHFLIGHAINAIPHPDVTDIKTNRLSRWQFAQQILQHFWKRWRVEYLSTLQQRFKWKNKCDNIRVGDLVIIHEENIPPMKWKLARVVEVHSGADGAVRVVSLKTASGSYKRPIVKLTPILFNNE